MLKSEVLDLIEEVVNEVEKDSSLIEGFSKEKEIYLRVGIIRACKAINRKAHNRVSPIKYSTIQCNDVLLYDQSA